MQIKRPKFLMINSSGISHIFVPLVVIVGVAIVGTYLLVATHADIAGPSVNGKTQIEGQLVLTHGDNFVKKTSVEQFAVVTAADQTTPVDFKGDPPDYNGIAKVQIKGTVKKGRLQVASKSDIKVKQITTPVETPHKTAVILYNYSDNPYQPITPDEARTMLFTGPKSASNFFKEESYGQRYLTGINNASGDVFGYYTIPASTNLCDSGALAQYVWRDQAIAAATADGHDMSAYDNVVLLSGSTNCGGAAGWGEVGGKYSWIYSSPYKPTDWITPIAQHELTHNFGTWHANRLHCTDKSGNETPISDNCNLEEYGDSDDIMGWNVYSGVTHHSNNYFLHDLGFIPPAVTQTVKKTGDYTLAPIEGPNLTPNSTLRVIRTINRPTNEYQYYYLEYRQNYGFDMYLPGDPATLGATVHLTSGSNDLIQSGLVLVHAGNYDKVNNGTLNDGDTFEDADHNIKITQVSHRPKGVKLHIEVSNVPTADTTPPSAPKNLHTLVSTTRNTTVEWSVSSESNIKYYKVYRNGAAIGHAYYYDDTGKVKFESLKKFTPGDSLVYTVKAMNSVGILSAASEPLTIVVPPADTSPPTAPSQLVGTLFSGKTEGAALKWQPSSDNKGVVSYIVYRTDKDGKVERFDTKYNSKSPSDSPNAEFWDYFRNAGETYTYTVKAYDSDYNKSKPSNQIKL